MLLAYGPAALTLLPPRPLAVSLLDSYSKARAVQKFQVIMVDPSNTVSVNQGFLSRKDGHPVQLLHYATSGHTCIDQLGPNTGWQHQTN